MSVQLKLLLLLSALIYSYNLKAQDANVIIAAVPFLIIPPDAISCGLGETGVATEPDVHSIFWNTSKLVFAHEQFAGSLSYNAVRSVDLIFLADASTYFKIDSNDVITASLRYFHLPKIYFTAPNGSPIRSFQPIEYTAHAGYARKITKEFSAGLNLGYVRSNLVEGYSVNNIIIQPADAIMIDFSVFFSHPIKRTSALKKYDFGMTISNLGNKIAYIPTTPYKDFLPANLGIGSNFDFEFGRYHQLTLAIDLNKLLVPTPDPAGNFRNETVAEGIVNSFTDAPGGFREEVQEVNISTGVQYWFRKMIALRTGYFYEDKNKGDQQFVTLGAGFKYSFLQLDVAYWLSTSDNKSTDKTFHLGLSFIVDSFHKKS